MAVQREVELERERVENERENARRSEIHDQVQNWKSKVEKEKCRSEIYAEMLEFERRQQFQENLPILREAADRRESLRLKKARVQNLIIF